MRLENTLDLSERKALEDLGLNMSTYGQMSYPERTAEYPRTQEIAELTRFLGHDGLIVPSARSDTSNVVVFCDGVGPDAFEPVHDHGVVDWSKVTG